MKVRIKKLGKLNKAAYGGQQPDGALDVVPSAWGGGDYRDMSTPKAKVGKTLTAIPRKEANLEAEGGETAFGPISGDTIPDHFNIKGARHSNGGVPLNLPDDTFIFSDTKAMRITDPKILKMFGKKPKKGGYTPAELAKPYDINKYKEILMDPDSDRKQRETAELMIKNYIMKLGALALAQEAKKGFPQGIPEMARPYMEANGITEEDLIPQEAEEQQQMMAQQQGPPPQQMPGGAPVAMPQEMSMQPPMAYGGFSDLDRFVYAQNGLVVEGDEEGLITDPLINVLSPTPWEDAFQNINAPDNPYITQQEIPQIEVDNPDPITNQQVEEGSVEKIEPLINAQLTDKQQKKLDRQRRKDSQATFKLRNFGDINTAELGRRIFNYAMPGVTNIIKGLDNSRIAGDDQRAMIGRRDAAINEVDTGIHSALSGRQFPYKQGTEMIVQYGGVPMAAYGMMMGGYDMPFTEDRRKVRVKRLPNAQDGITVEGIGATPISQADLDAQIAAGTLTGAESSIGTPGGWAADYDVTARGNIGSAQFQGTKSEYLAGICQSMKTGSYKNRSLQWMIDNKIVSSADAPQLADCVTVEKRAVYTEPKEDPQTEEKWCECERPDGTIDTFPLPEGKEKCECPQYTDLESQEAQVPMGYGDYPHWSDVATRGVYTAATMDPNVARAQVAMPGRVEVRPAYEDYLAKKHAVQSAVNTANRRAAQTADSTALKQAQLSQLIGKAAPAVAQAVAQTQARNIQNLGRSRALQGQHDARWAAQQADALTKQAFINASVRDKETLNWNAIRAQTQGKIQEAEQEMQGRALTNYVYPQYSTDYAQGLPYFTGVPKPLQLEKPGLTASEMLVSPELAGLSDAAKEAIIVKRMNQGLASKGGYIMGTNVYPFVI